MISWRTFSRITLYTLPDGSLGTEAPKPAPGAPSVRDIRHTTKLADLFHLSACRKLACVPAIGYIRIDKVTYSSTAKPGEDPLQYKYNDIYCVPPKTS